MPKRNERTFELDGVKLLAVGDSVVVHIENGEEFEPDTRRAWREFCKPGQTVVDVGAYTGLFSIMAAKLGAKPIAFEPMPDNHKRVTENASINGVSFPVYSYALSDETGVAVLYFNPRVKGLTAGASLEPSKIRTKRFDVVTQPLDSLALPECIAMKIDVEGCEARVLRGARDTIRRCRPRIIAEVLDAKAEGAMWREIGEIAYRRIAILDVRNWLICPT